MGAALLQEGEIESATALVLQLEAYLRLSEAVTLTRRNLLPPAPLAGTRYAQLWGLVIAPQADGQRTNTRHTGDPLLPGNVARPWMRTLMELVYKNNADEDPSSQN